MDFINGSEAIVKDYGYWPNFHDDCIYKIVINGSSIDLYVRMVSVPPCFEEYFVCITFDQVIDFKLEGELLGTVSIILNLEILKEKIVSCELYSSMGVYGQINAKEVSIRKLFIDIDLSQVNDIQSLHSILAMNFHFPKFYGMNWDAFWDAITGLVAMPNMLIIKGWDNFKSKFIEDSKILSNLLDNYKRDFNNSFKVIYK